MAIPIPRRTGAVLGGAGLAAWAALYLVAALSYPGYDVTRNFLSDLGHPDAPAAWAFNAGAILGGLLFLPFALAVGSAVGGRLGILGGACLAGSAIGLAFVGVSHETSPNNLHFIVSAIFFLLQALGAAALALPMHASRLFGPMSGLLAAADLAASVVFLGTGDPLYEHVTVFTALGWTAWNVGRLYQGKTA